MTSLVPCNGCTLCCKNDAIEDLEKAVWYVNREINRRKIQTQSKP